MGQLSPRQNAILNQVRQQGRVLVGDLAGAFGTTPQTIRKDLQALSDAHLVVRFHGGATLIAGVEYTSFEVRETIAAAQKEAIGEAVATRIPNNVTVFINAGTTTAAAARALRHHAGLKVVTDNVSMANDLRVLPGVDVIVPGGTVRRSDGTVLGAAAVDFLRQFQADFAIVGAAAMGENGELYDYDLNEAHVARTIVEQASHVILAADSSKFGRSAPVRIAHLSQVHTMVTDVCADQRLRGLCDRFEVDVFEACAPGRISLAAVPASSRA